MNYEFAAAITLAEGTRFCMDVIARLVLADVRSRRMCTCLRWYGIECYGRWLDRPQSLRVAARLKDLFREETIAHDIAELPGSTRGPIFLSGYPTAMCVISLCSSMHAAAFDIN